MSDKKIYQKPAIINLSDQTVYGSFDTPMGQCQSGASPMGSRVGCVTGNLHTAGNCAFGQYPDSAVCTYGSNVGFASQCNTGGVYVD